MGEVRAPISLNAGVCIKCDLEQVELAGRYLGGVDLQGANMTGANLAWTVLYQANLAGAIGVEDEREP